MSLIELKGVTKTYQHGPIGVPAICDINLKIAAAEFTVIKGPSGSGKTTLLNLIGILDVPSAGKVFLDGKDVGSLSKNDRSVFRRDKLGFVFQYHNLIPVLTALENTEFILYMRGVEKFERRRRSMSILKDIGLEGLESRLPAELSGGQQQRVAVARAIVGEPLIVLADEPTSSLDSKSAEALLLTMSELNQKRGITFLFSTHDDKVIRRARRVISMEDGRIV